jgi:hypothetical protein
VNLPHDLKDYTAPPDFDAGLAYDIFWLGLIILAIIL